jgi:phosphinothricin acetyltransferase
MNEGVKIRLATAADLDAINDIYNHYVTRSTCTYQVEPTQMHERRSWFADRTDRHPVTVAELAGQTVGWGALSAYHRRAAYSHTVENSVYVRHDMHRRGIGSALLADLIRRARQAGHHSIIAVIDADQNASIRLHERLGFERVGHFREVGRKFGRWLDVIYLELLLA